jgi:hypothetical protein
VRAEILEIETVNCTNLEELSCFRKGLNKLHVSSAIKLKKIECSQNNLTRLDISKNVELVELYCGSNQLINLDVSRNLKLQVLACQNNKFNSEALNEIFNSLPSVQNGQISIIGNPGERDCNKSIAEKKGWVFVEYN